MQRRAWASVYWRRYRKPGCCQWRGSPVVNRPYKPTRRRGAWWFTPPKCWLSSRTRSRKFWAARQSRRRRGRKIYACGGKLCPENGVRAGRFIPHRDTERRIPGAAQNDARPSAAEILAEVLPAAILGLTFPKSMYWTEKSDPRFVRPIRWILALLGEGKAATTVSFRVPGSQIRQFYLRPSRYWFGKPLIVKGFRITRENWLKLMSRLTITSGLIASFRGLANGRVTLRHDRPGRLADGLDRQSTEWPRPMLGSFDERFLHLPREILITVMRDHQRYFARPRTDQGILRPHFVAVLNMDSDDRVDPPGPPARADGALPRCRIFLGLPTRKLPLRDRKSPSGKSHVPGTAWKLWRLRFDVMSIARYIGATLESRGRLSPEQKQHVLRAVELCKCDLTAQMVQEFTELQGIVGGLYAKAQGEPEEVSSPFTIITCRRERKGFAAHLVGAVVSLADKIDSVVAGFAAGTNRRLKRPLCAAAAGQWHN